MKRVVSLMICALLLLGLGDNASAAEEDFAEAIGAQSFAAAMSFWNAEDPAFSESGNDRVWDMAGWYAAWMYRTEGWDLVGERQLEDFRRSIAVESESTPPGYWTEYGALRVLHGSDGADSYDFIQHKSDVDAMLGIYMAVSVTPAEGLGAIAEVRYYYENGGWDSWRYALEFAENPEADSAFAYRLTGVTPLSTEPELSGDLSFTWEELQAANGLDQILSVYPAVRISNLGYETEASTWLFQRGGETALVSEGTDYVSGQFHGCAFYLVTLGDGTQRARVGSYYESMSGQNSLEDYVLGYLVDIRTMELDRIEGDLIWTNCSCLGGNKETLAFDRGTLVLREMTMFYGGDTPPFTLRFSYTEQEPDYAFLNSWEDEIRRVTLHWESYYTGQRETWTETVEIPADWEVYPYEVYWGDYTIYMNETYTKLYEYPGPGVDYALYLTSAKG